MKIDASLPVNFYIRMNCNKGMDHLLGSTTGKVQTKKEKRTAWQTDVLF